jgi:signal transduction histidine kinase
VPDPSHPVSPTALRAAERDLLREIADRATLWGDPDELRRRLHATVEAIEEGGRSPCRPDCSALEVASFHGILEQLRARTVEIWSRSHPAPDPSELIALLRTMEQMQQNLRPRDANDSLSSLLALVRGPEMLFEFAHDLRSPLTSILFLVETLRRGGSGELNAHQHHQLGIVYSAALSLISMAGDVLDLSRGGEHLAQKDPAAFSIASVFESVLDLVRPMTDERAVELRSESPEYDSRMGYPVALGRVLLNLTTNALKSTDRGFVELAARGTGGDVVEFSVRDSGRGIDPEVIPTLFEPFQSRSGIQRISFSSAGLGLWICRRLVRAMGGELGFETTPEQGTRFHFELSLPSAPLV